MRQDELASQETIRRSQQFGKNVGNIAKAGLGVAGAALSARLAPLLSPYLSPSLALKGIEKVAPDLGRKIRRGLEEGLTLEDGINYLRKAFNPGQEESQEPQGQEQHPNITPLQDLEARYPQLMRALMRSIQNGTPPDGAAAILKNFTEFNKDISAIERETGKNFVDLIIELMGEGGQPQEDFGQMGQMQQVSQNEMQNPMSPTGNVQGSAIDPKLIQLLQGLQQGIKNLRGPQGG